MAQSYMDDEVWTYEESPEDASRFHVIVIVTTCKPGQQVLESNRIKEVGGERRMKGRSLVISIGGTDQRCQRKALTRT